jgi:hypothetical protein
MLPYIQPARLVEVSGTDKYAPQQALCSVAGDVFVRERNAFSLKKKGIEVVIDQTGTTQCT